MRCAGIWRYWFRYNETLKALSYLEQVTRIANKIEISVTILDDVKGNPWALLHIERVR